MTTGAAPLDPNSLPTVAPALVRLDRYLWVKRGMWLPMVELESAMASDLDGLADGRFGPGRWRRASTPRVRWVRRVPADAPPPPTTVRADLYLGSAYYEMKG